MQKFNDKYRIPSARLQSWDYGADGAYFITICTQNREHFFGKILSGQMLLNQLGQLAEKYWMEIPKHFPFIELGHFVVMPNHTHGILIIDKSYNGNTFPNATDNHVEKGSSGETGSSVETPKLGISTAAKMKNGNLTPLGQSLTNINSRFNLFY